MAENTLQYRWIVLLIENIRHLFAHDPNVFVAGDLLWYPVQGRPDISLAPDCMVAFGPRQGDRGCYKQWEEGTPPQVVFEVLSPSNTPAGMMDKLRAYEGYGVEEVYYYDPDRSELRGWVREGNRLAAVKPIDRFMSPRLNIRFHAGAGALKIERPDGTFFESFDEISQRAEMNRQRAEEEGKRAEEERKRAEEEHRRAEEEHGRAEEERQRADRLEEKFRSLGLDPGSI
jgi:Uma2 family endonuclease